MSAVRVAVNGLGRTGRNTLRLMLASEELDVVGLNDLTSAAELAHLIKYDSVHGVSPLEITARDGAIQAGTRVIPVFSEKDPARLPWKSLGVDVVLESTGKFRSREDASRHLAAGARRVLISAPGKSPDWTVVLGVNEKDFDPARHFVISNASCTTNCAAPVARVLQEAFGIERGLLTTVHSFTNDQRLLDLPHKDLRRARAATLSMIPTTTGAAESVGEVLPSLSGRLDGIAIRVPTPDVSILDLTAVLERDASPEAVARAFREAAAGPLAGILEVSDRELVSVDFVGSRASAVVDLPLTRMAGPRLLKVFAWYDNEVGYGARCRDVISLIGKR